MGLEVNAGHAQVIHLLLYVFFLLALLNYSESWSATVRSQLITRSLRAGCFATCNNNAVCQTSSTDSSTWTCVACENSSLYSPLGSYSDCQGAYTTRQCLSIAFIPVLLIGCISLSAVRFIHQISLCVPFWGILFRQPHLIPLHLTHRSYNNVRTSIITTA